MFIDPFRPQQQVKLGSRIGDVLQGPPGKQSPRKTFLDPYCRRVAPAQRITRPLAFDRDYRNHCVHPIRFHVTITSEYSFWSLKSCLRSRFNEATEADCTKKVNI